MLDMDGVDRDRDSVDSKLGFYCILDLVLPCSSIDDALHLILPRPPYLPAIIEPPFYVEKVKGSSA